MKNILTYKIPWHYVVSHSIIEDISETGTYKINWRLVVFEKQRSNEIFICLHLVVTSSMFQILQNSQKFALRYNKIAVIAILRQEIIKDGKDCSLFGKPEKIEDLPRCVV